MWAVKTVRLPERVRNFSRYKRVVLAFLVSAVLIISIIYMGSFLSTAQSVPEGNSDYFEIYIANGTMGNVLMNGSYAFNSLSVTMVTADNATLSGMLLVREGSLELEVPSIRVKNLMAYTTYLFARTDVDNWVNITVYGYNNGTIPYPGLMSISDVYMQVVYLYAESFSAPEGLSLTLTP